MKYSVWFFRIMILGSAAFIAVALLKRSEHQKVLVSVKPVVSPVTAALTEQESPEAVFVAFQRAISGGDLSRIKQLTHPKLIESLGNGEGPRWNDWINTLRVQMADAKMKQVKYHNEEGIEFAEMAVLLNSLNLQSSPRAGNLRFLKINGSWYWAER